MKYVAYLCWVLAFIVILTTGWPGPQVEERWIALGLAAEGLVFFIIDRLRATSRARRARDDR